MNRLSLAAFASLALAAVGPARADSFTYQLNTFVNGDPVAGTPTTTIADFGVGTVRITLDLTGATTPQFADTWLLNFSGDPTSLTFNYLTGLGLSTGPAAETIGLDEQGRIDGLF